MMTISVRAGQALFAASLLAGACSATMETSTVAAAAANGAAAGLTSTAGPDPTTGGLTIETLQSLSRVSGLSVSPDGSAAAFVIREADLAGNRGLTDVWTLDLTEPGAEPVRLTTHEASDYGPQWSADGAHVYFLSSRTGSAQVWRAPALGGDAEQVTDLAVDVETMKLRPGGGALAFTAQIYPDCANLACTAERLAAAKLNPQTGRVYDRLFVRHWDSWEDGRRSALFTLRLDEAGQPAGDPVKVSGALDGDTPTPPFSGSEAYSWRSQTGSLFFSLRVAGKSEPWSTDKDIYVTSADGGEPSLVSHGRDGYDTHPLVSPDGEKLAWFTMRRPGYEADQNEIVIKDLAHGGERIITQDWDRSPGEMVWTPDSRALIVSASDVGTHPLFQIDIETGAATKLTEGKYAHSPAPAGDRLVFLERSLAGPDDIWALSGAEGEKVRLTDLNAAFLADVEMGAYEQFSFAGANGATVYGYAMKPAGYQEGEDYPVAFIVHGGPQGSFSEGWSYRWNPQIYAGAGYGVVFIDFHGSTGYGQDFTDAINQDWGGKPLVDLQKGLDAALARYDWLDGEKVCALGASYGGYMINWIAGNWPDRFSCLVNHNGLFDMRSFYYATEELWFPEWDFGGAYFDVPENYERWNPANHVDKWRTPMLVIHSDKDFRVPPEQGLQTFTALQRQGVESKLLFFPDENHWVLKPQNSVQWHHTVLGWLDEHLKD